ncbi:MAG: DUF951 domain-containing protein [Bacilli bacterium]|nr:DUF951 domain-containing protein [Bacilli bacterium]
MNYQLGDIVVLKKEHPCTHRTKEFEVVRLGADIRIKCLGCGRTLLLERAELDERIEKIIKK